MEIMSERIFFGPGQVTGIEYQIVTKSGFGLQIENVGGPDGLMGYAGIRAGIEERHDNPPEGGQAELMMSESEKCLHPVNPFVSSGVRKAYILLWNEDGCDYAYIHHYVDPPKEISRRDSHTGKYVPIPKGEYLRIEYPNENILEVAVGYHEIGDEKREFRLVALNGSSVESEEREKALKMMKGTVNKLRTDVPYYFVMDKKQ